MNNLKIFILKILSLPFKPFVGTGFTNYFPFNKLYGLYVKITPHSLQEVETRYGFKMIVDPKVCVDSAIFIGGVWEPSIGNLIEKYLKPGMTFLDIGANIGYYTLFASKIVGEDGKVISIEPNLIIFERLSKNVGINEFTNITLHKVGAGKEKGEFESHFCELNPGASSLIETDENKNFQKEKVKVEKLDDLLNGETVDFIKMDVEGFEWEVIQGMTNILKTTKYMFFEYSPCIKQYDENLLDYLEEIGFKLFHIVHETGKIEEITNTKSYFESVKGQSDVFCKKI